MQWNSIEYEKNPTYEYSANIAVIKPCNAVLLYVKWTEMVTVTVLSEVDCSQERGSYQEQLSTATATTIAAPLRTILYPATIIPHRIVTSNSQVFNYVYSTWCHISL